MKFKLEVTQNIFRKFFYKLISDTVGPFEDEETAQTMGKAALKTVEGQNRQHHTTVRKWDTSFNKNRDKIEF